MTEKLYKYFDTYTLLSDAIVKTKGILNSSIPDIIKDDFESNFDLYDTEYDIEGKTYLDAYNDFLLFLVNREKLDLVQDTDYEIEVDKNNCITIGFYTQTDEQSNENGTTYTVYGYEFVIDLDTTTIVYYQHINHN